MTDQQHTFAFIGSYADRSGPGVYVCRYNSEHGKLEVVSQTDGLQDPTFLDLNDRADRLYIISENMSASGQKQGTIVSCAIDAKTGALTLLNEQPSVQSATCHIAIDRTNTCLIVSSYDDGIVGVSDIKEDGRVGAVTDVHRLEGSPLHRAHSAYIDSTNRYVIVSDLGADELLVYKLDTAKHRLTLHHKTRVAAGSGPRHFAFHPNRPFGYGINELNSTINVYAFDADSGELQIMETVSTLPSGYRGQNFCADIHLSPDGKFLYGSNRGHDSIVVFAVEPFSGRLTYVEHVSTGGKHPRNFAIAPDGRYLLAANRFTNNIVTFARDIETGKLTATGHTLEVSQPVCIKFSSSHADSL